MAEDEGTRTLYANKANDRFFWIPDSHKPEPGTINVRSLTGTKLAISDGEASQWEVDEDQAKELAQIQLSRYSSAASSMMSAAGQVLRQAAANSAKTPSKPNITKGEQGIADAIGVTPEQLKSDPEAVLEGLKHTLQGMGETIKQQLSDNPADKEQVKARMELLAAVVRKQTGDESMGDNLEEAPQKIADFLANPELVDRVKKATEDLRAASQEIRNATKKD